MANKDNHDTYLDKFVEDDFDCLVYNLKGDEDSRLRKHQSVLTKLKKLHQDIWAQYGSKHFLDNKISRVINKAESLWFGYYGFKDNAQHVNLNFSINHKEFNIEVNAELSQSVKRLIRNIKKDPKQFDAILENLSLKVKLKLYTKLPLKPEKANFFYWKPVHEESMAKINSSNIIKQTDHIILNFDQYMEEMINEVENDQKYSKNDTAYVKKTYCGNSSKNMHPLSFSVIRFTHSIDKAEFINAERQALLKRLISTSKELANVIDFGNM